MFIGMGGPQAHGRGKAKELEPGWTENDVVKGLTHLYGVIGKVEEKARKEQNLPCKAGCSWCCENSTVLLTQAEWLIVLRFLKAADRKRTRKLLRRCLIAHKKYAGVVKRITENQTLADGYASEIALPCPFLDESVCGVYEARPHDCRLFGSSFREEGLYACHLVEDALVGRSVELPRYESSGQLIQLYPLTELRQVFAYWAKNHLPEKLRELALGPEQG